MKTCSPDIKDFIFNLQRKIAEIIKDDLIGFYIHGSLAMGGFNLNSSDIDVLAVTNKSMTVDVKRALAKLFLTYSSSPYPLEITFLNKEQLIEWQHPCQYDFHFSEFWRERYVDDLLNGTDKFLNGHVQTDADLAVHITITNYRGVCVKGKPIDEVFPQIPASDYLLSIMGDFKECLENIEEDPIYCTLNMIRVYMYLQEGVISSKLEAGKWGRSTFPKEMKNTIKKVVECYTNDKNRYNFEKGELVLLKNYLSGQVQRLL